MPAKVSSLSLNNLSLPNTLSPPSLSDFLFSQDWTSWIDQHQHDALFLISQEQIVYANAACLSLFHAGCLSKLIGSSYLNLPIQAHIKALLQQAKDRRNLHKTAQAIECIEIEQTHSNKKKPFELRIELFQHANAECALVCLRDLEYAPIPQIKEASSPQDTIKIATDNFFKSDRSHQALHHEKEILEMIALDNPLSQILQDVCDRMESLLDNGSICAIMLLDASKQFLQLRAAPHLPSPYLHEVSNYAVPFQEWSCGSALTNKRLHIVEDVSLSTLWQAQHNPSQAGLFSCWSLPITTAFNIALGTIDVYHPDQRTPNEDEITLISDAMNVVALAIDKKNMEQSLATSEDRYRSVVTNLTEGIMMIGQGGRILTCNPSAKRILKIRDIQATGRRHRYFKRILREDGSDIPLGQDPASQVFYNGQPISNLSIGLQLQDSSIAWLLVNAQPIFNTVQKEMIDAVLISFTDTTEVRETERQLHYIANHDTLTGLPNRHQFQQRLSQVLHDAYQEKIALIFLDLDHFKNVNDTAGHAAGDALLRDVANRLNACIRNSDMLARLGGDEFVIIAEDIENARHIEDLAERILAKISDPFIIDGNQYHLGTSIGISVFPHDGKDSATLLRCADSAMYLAKEKGRNNYQFFTHELTLRAQHRYTLEKNLRTALQNEEFALYFQAKVCLQTQRIVGAETLIRWIMPDLAIIPPNEFIPFAEEIGLIVPIGHWVLKQACIHAQYWRSHFSPNFVISVNISPKQFQDPNLPLHIKNILEETGLPAHALQLEITEGLLMNDAEHLLASFAFIKQLGVHISLDDFGTGFSSLSYLQRFPIDNLKIDRSFIANIPEHQDSVVLTRAIIAMASALGMNVTAEGVENLEQMLFLQDAGCHKMQGFYFSQPISRDQFQSLLLKSNIIA
jgi:diguanylate cyclase (GGDEF)-like protein